MLGSKEHGEKKMNTILHSFTEPSTGVSIKKPVKEKKITPTIKGAHNLA